MQRAFCISSHRGRDDLLVQQALLALQVQVVEVEGVLVAEVETEVQEVAEQYAQSQQVAGHLRVLRHCFPKHTRPAQHTLPFEGYPLDRSRCLL